MKKLISMVLCSLALTVGGFSQNYSECQAPDAHMNPNCNGSAPAAGSGFQGGSYAVQGSTPEGTKYGGSVVISGDATAGFRVVWTIGNETYEGTGTLSGSTLTVDWGQAEPVVYRIVGGGATLNGKWGKRGRGREKLTRQ